jgi:carbon storage regulator CsrA
MLVLQRKVSESVVIGTGPDAVTVSVREVHRGRVRLAFDGPKGVAVWRKEVLDARTAESEKPSGLGDSAAPVTPTPKSAPCTPPPAATPGAGSATTAAACP